MNRLTDAVSSLALLSLLLFSAKAPCQSIGSIGPSNGQVAAVVAGIAGAGGAITAGAIIAVNHERHTLKGCASTGPNGLQLETDSDKRTYSLAGVTADVKPGEVVKLHGSKVKKHKENPGNQEFLVEKVTKDYGPCKVLTAATPTATTATKN